MTKKKKVYNTNNSSLFGPSCKWAKMTNKKGFYDKNILAYSAIIVSDKEVKKGFITATTWSQYYNTFYGCKLHIF